MSYFREAESRSVCPPSISVYIDTEVQGGFSLLWLERPKLSWLGKVERGRTMNSLISMLVICYRRHLQFPDTSGKCPDSIPGAILILSFELKLYVYNVYDGKRYKEQLLRLASIFSFLGNCSALPLSFGSWKFVVNCSGTPGEFSVRGVSTVEDGELSNFFIINVWINVKGRVQQVLVVRRIKKVRPRSRFPGQRLGRLTSHWHGATGGRWDEAVETVGNKKCKARINTT